MKKNFILLVLLVLIMSGLVSLLIYRAHRNDLYFEAQNQPPETEESLEVPEI